MVDHAAPETTNTQTHELRLQVPPSRKDDFASYLVGLGLAGFVEGALDCDIPFEYGPDHLHHDYYVDHDNGQTPLVFYATTRAELEETLQRIRSGLASLGLGPDELQVAWGILDEADWKDSWKQSFRPLLVAGRLAILPPWEDPQQHKADVHIIIDPGMAFGTGQHETTQLCLRLYLERTPLSFDRVLDVGTGSGILSIAAHKLGCRNVTGCDIDPDSARIAAENARLNGCAGIQFSARAIESFADAGFDLVFANITARPLISLLPGIASKALTGATLISSGVLVSEAEEFQAALESAGFVVVETMRHNDWIGFLARRAQ